MDSITPVEDRLTALLLRGQALASRDICQKLGISQPTLSRAVARLGERICRMGAARMTRYALANDILGLPARCELRWGGANHAGNMPADFGHITYLHGNGLHVQSGRHEWLTQGRLPWFLTPLRPQGFLARELARVRTDLAADPAQWSLAQILHVAISHIHDPIGAFFLGSTEPRATSIPPSSAGRAGQYEMLATQTGTGLPAGSTAAGEQPKFTVNQPNGACHIVKFTPPRGTPYGERWHALLTLEKLALDVLSSQGIACAATELVVSQRRTFLQSTRFDRPDGTSRRHVVALEALHDGFAVGSREHWVRTAAQLHAQHLISVQELQRIATLHAFGHFIGNTDMHFGNLSFFVDDVITPTICLAPVYDMLPMMWRPSEFHGLSDSPVRQQPLPSGFVAAQEQARQWAIEFWEQAALADIGTDLQRASLVSAQRLKTHFANG